MKYLFTLIIILTSSIPSPSFGNWDCRFTSEETQESINPEQENIEYKVSDESFSLTQFYEYQKNPKAIEYKIFCLTKFGSCSGSKKIDVGGQKKTTTFFETVTSKGSELNEFRQIRYLASVGRKFIKIRSTHRNKISVECVNDQN